MVTFEVVSGVTCTASEAVYDRFVAECREAQIQAQLEAWLADPANEDSESYSDIFKDVYGVRPRW